MIYLDLLELRKAIRRWAPVLLLGTIGATLVGFGASFLVRPVYESSALVVIAESPIETASVADAAGSLAGLVGVQAETTMRRQEELLAMFRSREFIEDFVRDNDLLPVLFPGQWDGDESRWINPGDPPTQQDAYERIRRDVVSVEDSRRTALVKISVCWHDPVQAARWVQDLIDRANARQREATAERARAALAYLGAETGKTNSMEIRQTIYRMVEAQMRDQMLASVTKDYAFRVVDPPFAADLDRFVRPRRALIAALFGAVAFFVMCVCVLRSSIVLRSAEGE